jgi:acetylornithine deacetylase
VVAEPTDLTIAVGHKGFAWVEVTTAGRAAHGSRPAEGRDAILHMGRVLHRLEALDRDLQRRDPDPLLGAPSLHASLIDGGRELSTYPDRCRLALERRTVVGEDANVASRELERILAALREEDGEFEATARPMFSRPAYRTPAGHPLLADLAQAVADGGRAPVTAGVTFWTDAAILGEAGIPSVVFGPGGAGLHGLEEYVRVDDVLECQRALTGLVQRFCGRSGT